MYTFAYHLLYTGNWSLCFKILALSSALRLLKVSETNSSPEP